MPHQLDPIPYAAPARSDPPSQHQLDTSPKSGMMHRRWGKTYTLSLSKPYRLSLMDADTIGGARSACAKDHSSLLRGATPHRGITPPALDPCAAALVGDPLVGEEGATCQSKETSNGPSKAGRAGKAQ